MKIKQITARAGRVLPHPTRSFANIKADIELVADLEDGEDEAKSIRDLQVRTERIVESHVKDVRQSIVEGEALESTYERMERLESELEALRTKTKSRERLLFADVDEVER